MPCAFISLVIRTFSSQPFLIESRYYNSTIYPSKNEQEAEKE